MFYSGQCVKFIVGLDCDDGKIEVARQFAASVGAESCEFVVGKAEETPFADCFFDLVISEDGFEHFPDPQGVLREANRVLVEGGHLLILFSTYWTPSGPHLYNFVRVPYAHLLFDEETMISATREIARRRESLSTYEKVCETPIRQAEREIAQLSRFINHISLRRFKRIVCREQGWQLVYYHRYVTRRRWLPFVLLRNAPVLDELQSDLLFLLRKSDGHSIRRFDFFSRRTVATLPRVMWAV